MSFSTAILMRIFQRHDEPDYSLYRYQARALRKERIERPSDHWAVWDAIAGRFVEPRDLSDIDPDEKLKEAP